MRPAPSSTPSIRTFFLSSSKAREWKPATGLRQCRTKAITKLEIEFSPFVEKGGLGKAWQLFLEGLDPLLDDLHYIEEHDGKLHAYEFKWNPNAKVKNQKTFPEAYPGSEIWVITPKNFDDFVIIRDEKK